jgi:SAM-dependent methyltransferase
MTAAKGDEDLLAEHQWGSGTGPEHTGPRHDYRESLILRRLRRGAPQGHVLNAGAGAGTLTAALLDRGYRVTSVDMSEPFVERLREVTIERGGDGADVAWADLTQIPFADDSFDVVVCGEVLEHIPDDVTAVGELHRVLRPGGLLVVSVPANPWRYDWVDNWVGHIRRYTQEGLAGRLSDAGFDAVVVEGWGFPVTGLYHRLAYRRLMRRRVRAGAPAPRAAGRRGLPARLALLGFRAVLELDTLFIGRFPGYFGLLATARG